MSDHVEFRSGFLSVDDTHDIYWEESGNPDGKPALYLHGGPGSGTSAGYRKHFDSEKIRIISLDQRGCGKSRPLATCEGYNLSSNNTADLIEDIEKLRNFLNVKKWLLLGVSWGTTLALRYAQAHFENVTEMVLMCVTTTSKEEVNWITEGMQIYFPKEWDEFINAVDFSKNEKVIDAYYRNITSPLELTRIKTANAWCKWEDTHVSLDPNYKAYPKFQNQDFCLLFATLVIHYWKNTGFDQGKKIIDNMNVIEDIPTALIHGRLDISSPVRTAWDIHNSLANSNLTIIDEEGHGGEKMISKVRSAIADYSLQ